ncbi:hypothetical protein DK427_07735 [Methylobacterium radiodurans]|uniref:Uncharacterized protein n=1 Tax=Methylobacterium radiodurans TaxID=2202828 RepID=A0A2U8W0B7_9HYPH|nr:hypothetical protein DK427_07735 [Methylobacterium radiodurans]
MAESSAEASSKAAPKAAPRSLPKGARRTTPSVETLAALDHERLIGLVLDETRRNPAFRKLVSAALAARQGPDAVARIVDRRLAALEGARGYIDWQKRRAFALDLDTTVSVILNELRPLDAEAALERLLRFLGGADDVFARVDDGTGTVQGVYDRAAEAAVEIGAGLPPATAARFASALLPRVLADPTGALTVLLRGLIGRLDPAALAPLDAEVTGLAAETGARAGRRETETLRRLQRRLLLRLRQDIAERRGDIDAFIALEVEAVPGSPDRVDIATRLLGADRPAEALDWLRRKTPQPLTRADLIAGLDETAMERERAVLEIQALDALGRGAEAQDLRWRGFAQRLDADMLRAYLAKLPDFEDDEALRRAFAVVEAFPDPHRALGFLVRWPDLDRAARLVTGRPEIWAGERYTILAPAAEALAQAHPLAATILYRALLDDILARGRSQAYTHGAAYLLELDLIAERADLGGLKPDPSEYREGLKRRHGRKYGFWDLVEGG